VTGDEWRPEAHRPPSATLVAAGSIGGFEQRYTAGGLDVVQMPWARMDPHPLLRRWTRERAPRGAGRMAAVVGCGLGADAEYVAALGFSTVAFDVSRTAVAVVRSRFPRSSVRYVIADVLDLPPEWVAGFDLVVEVQTVQAVPAPTRRMAIDEVARLLAPGGSLIVVAAAEREGDVRPVDPPWPLTQAEIDSFGLGGLTAVHVERIVDENNPAYYHWLAEFRASARVQLT
jgi:SAM-dependent methyltransferase